MLEPFRCGIGKDYTSQVGFDFILHPLIRFDFYSSSMKLFPFSNMPHVIMLSFEQSFVNFSYWPISIHT